MRPHRSRPPAVPPSTTKALRILVLSDEVDLASTWVRFFRLVGHPVCSLSPLSEALAAVAREAPELVLLDLARPPTLAALDLFRQIQRRIAPAPLLLSGPPPSGAYLRQALSTGAVEWLAKPFSLAELRQAVERAARSPALAADGG